MGARCDADENGCVCVDRFRDDVLMVLGGDPKGLVNVAYDLTHLTPTVAAEMLYRMAAERGAVDNGMYLGNLLEETGRLDEALECFRREYEDGNPDGALAVAQLYETLGDLDEARTWFEKEPDHELTPVRLARVLRKLGEHDRSDQVLRAAIETNQEAAVEWVTQGELDGAAAIDLLERHLAAGATDVLIPLANLYEEQGRIDDAIAALQRSVAGGEVWAAHNLAFLLWDTGRRKEAAIAWRYAAERGDVKAKRRLVRLARRRTDQVFVSAIGVVAVAGMVHLLGRRTVGRSGPLGA